MEKRALRERMRAMRRALSPGEQERASQAVFERLLAFPAYRKARCVMAYAASRGELSLAPMMEHVLACGKTLALPRCDGPGVMTARQVKALAELSAGAFGLPEPEAGSRIVCPEEIEMILVPGTAFDRAGRRLGQGGGYYDRFLMRTDALLVGVCHEAALIESVPQEAHDRRMDAVITPQALYLCKMDK